MSFILGSLSGTTALLYFFILLSILGSETFGSENFESFPLFKYDQGEVVSRKNSFNLAATSYHSSYDENASRSKAILLPYTVRMAQDI